MSLIVIHSYHRAERQGIVNLVAAYRGFPDRTKERLTKELDQKLRGLLCEVRRRNGVWEISKELADLMVAFGTTTPLRFEDAEPEDRSFI
jgi:hypothetical protein